MPGAELGEDGLDLPDVVLGHAFAAGQAALQGVEHLFPHVDGGRVQAGPDAAAGTAVVELPKPGEALRPDEAPLVGLGIAVGPLDIHAETPFRRELWRALGDSRAR